MSSKNRTRHRLLLDEGVHLPQKYPNLNKRHDLTHVYWANLKGKSDEKVFEFARKESRMIVVFNVKDFKKLIRPDGPSVISLSVNLSDRQADLKIGKTLKNLKPSQARGHLISINNTGINIEKTEKK